MIVWSECRLVIEWTFLLESTICDELRPESDVTKWGLLGGSKIGSCGMLRVVVPLMSALKVIVF